MISRYESIIITTLCKLLIPVIQLYGLYVIMHGHSSPGGGFQGGVILGASFILLVISHGLDEVKKRMSEKLNTIFCSFGLLIYAGLGVLALIFGGNYLDYGHLPIPVTIAEARYLGILGIEIGVGITVMAVMISIFLDISSVGEQE